MPKRTPSSSAIFTLWLLCIHATTISSSSSHYQGKHTEILKDFLGRKFGGTPGAYRRRSYLLAFIKEVVAEDLLDGADSRADPTALVDANVQITPAGYNYYWVAQEIQRVRLGGWGLAKKKKLVTDVPSSSPALSSRPPPRYLFRFCGITGILVG